MSYIATTIKNAVTNMVNRTAFLPAIQREFVWSTWDIEKLFDSIMCQYPISSMLFWMVRQENKKDWISYNFFSDFDTASPHNKEANLNAVNNDIYLVLDGQQRLTAMTIGLLGSYTYFYYKTRKTKLYVNIVKEIAKTANPEELTYHFQFRESATSDRGKENEQLWYEVGNILNFSDAEDAKDDITPRLADYTPEQQSSAKKIIGKLFARLCSDDCINYYVERTNDYDKIVEIFIRTNTGGIKLSYSDILLSTATAKWRNLNAREEIHNFTDELERDNGLSLGQDLIMKGAMYLTKGLPIKYQVSSFTRENLEKIEDNWEKIKDAFRETVKLIVSFGFRDKNLVSRNLILPVALYIYNNYKTNYSISTENKTVVNQAVIQRWFIIATLKNLLASSVDDKLKNIQRIILEAHEGGNQDFPYTKLNDFFEIKNEFSEEEIDTLLNYAYATRYSYLVLSLLYPNRDWKDNVYQEDHIFPKSTFSEKKLRQLNLSDEQVQFALENYNTICNLELLTETENKQKLAKPFNDWIKTRDDNFKQRHYIPMNLDYTYNNFKIFITERRKLLRQVLKECINKQYLDLVEAHREEASLPRQDTPPMPSTSSDSHSSKSSTP